MGSEASLKPEAPPAEPSAKGGWRLPVRIRVPERDELLAMALATLAMGLVLGLAIGPGLGSAGRVLPIIAGPLAQIPAATDSSADGNSDTTLPVLSAPAGSDSAASGSPAPAGSQTVAAVTPDFTSVEPAPEEPVTTTSGAPPETPEPDPAPEPAPETLPLAGTVLASSVNGRSFSLADRRGNLQTIFSEFPPTAGERIRTTVLPLVNGTFSEYGGRQSLADRDRATVRGMISFLDPELGVVVLSNRGTSLPLDGSNLPEGMLSAVPSDSTNPSTPLAEGDWVEVDLLLVEPDIEQASTDLLSAEGADQALSPEDASTEPVRPDFGLLIESLKSLEETASRIELTGRLLEIDPQDRTLVISADSVGLLESSIEMTAPQSFDLSGLKLGRVYSATVRRTAAGDLRLTGFSPGYSGKAADDGDSVFGEQGY
ncbi:MAG: hypothetical protein WD181_03380 [Solirubrobacterales bacterium]